MLSPRQQKVQNKSRNCKFCGKLIFIGKTNRLYCSRTCLLSLSRQLRLENNVWRGKNRSCVRCLSDFLPKIANQKLCTRECSIIYNSFEYKSKHGGLAGWEKLRFEAFKRDNFTCTYCGRNVKDDKIQLACDHVFPKSKGGENVLSNLVTSCRECNNGKKDVLL